MRSYAAYDLAIRSAIPLPELPVAPDRPDADLLIRKASVPEPPNGAIHAGPTGNRVLHDGSALLDFKGVGRFLVRDGREIVVEPAEGVEAGLLRLYILGAALGVALHQRGLLVLHASAVAIDGRAAIFLGHSGKGKSTLAAALHVRGHAVMADDVAAISMAAGTPRVLPALPQVKLWPDATSVLGSRARALPRLHPGVDKRRLVIDQGFPTEPLPIAALYCLSPGTAFRFAPLSQRVALLELIGHSYCPLLLKAKADAAHFRNCAQLVRAIPAFRLERSAMTDIPAMIGVVERALSLEEALR